MSSIKRELEDVTSPVAKKVLLYDASGFGVASIKPEFLVVDPKKDSNDDHDAGSKVIKSGKKGQNKNRDNRQVKEKYPLCPSINNPNYVCKFGAENCRFVHDLDFYLKNKKSDIVSDIFNICPIFKKFGYCNMGYKCRFLSTHSGNNEIKDIPSDLNLIDNHLKIKLAKKKYDFLNSNKVIDIIEAIQFFTTKKNEEDVVSASATTTTTDEIDDDNISPQQKAKIIDKNNKLNEKKELFNEYNDTWYFQTNKKKNLNYKYKKILSPLTTVGNLPFRRLCKENFNCDYTYSEMILALPLVQGRNSEWALTKSANSELNSFNIQIASTKIWQSAKATEILANSITNVNEINMNAGCPIDLLYKQGGGSALLDNHAKLIRMLNSMNYVSNDIPITVKIRTGTKENHPIADNLIKRLVFETDVSAITLHGRSRQQRYTKLADWDYVSKMATHLREQEHQFVDTLGKDITRSQEKIQFVGNGDVNNYKQWYDILDNNPDIDSIMIGRAALIKPWIFEEIDAKQNLDKSSQERMDMLKDFAQYSMEHWGTDDYGIQQSRRFFCEFMSFFHRYIPMGICERYPVKLNERPPPWKGRDELETLMGSTNSNDWIKLSEQFFGKADESFNFTPKHKSNSF